jgi:serine/threonine protein kinase
VFLLFSFFLQMYSYIQSRFYRSPEVLLGLPYDQQIDMWSLGCMLVEMHTGEPLFPGADQEEQMARIIQTLGMPPSSMIEQAQDRVRELFFVEVVQEDPQTGELVKAYCSRRLQSDRSPIPQTTLDEVIGVYTHGPQGRRAKDPGHTVERYEEYRDLIARMLIYNPEERITPAEALRHPFFTNFEQKDTGIEMDGTQQHSSVQQRHPSNHRSQSSSQQPRQRHAAESSSTEAMAIQRTPQHMPRHPPHQNGTGPVPGPAPTTPPATLQTWSVSSSAHTPPHLIKASKPNPPSEPFVNGKQLPRYTDLTSEKLVAGTFTTEYA